MTDLTAASVTSSRASSWTQRALPGSVGVVSMGCADYDLDSARDLTLAALAVVAEVVDTVVGSPFVRTDPEDVSDGVARWGSEPEIAVVIQATFTDSRFAEAVAASTDAPLLVWSFPDERGADRPQRNALAGLNVAAHRLGCENRDLRYLHLDPRRSDAAEHLRAALRAAPPMHPPIGMPARPAPGTAHAAAARAVVSRLARSRLSTVADPRDEGADGHHAPCTSEADPLGGLTISILESLTGSPAVPVDLVDIDQTDDTALLWQREAETFSTAGQASQQRCDLGLILSDGFSLQPGPATLARLSQSRDVLRLVLGDIEVLDRPLAYSGTAGTVSFGGRPVAAVLDTIVAEGLEQHLYATPWAVRAELMEIAALLKLPVVEL